MGLLKLYPFYGCNNSGIFIWAGDSYVRTDKIWNLNSPGAALCDSRGILFHIGNIVDWRRGMVGFQTDSSYAINIILFVVKMYIESTVVKRKIRWLFSWIIFGSLIERALEVSTGDIHKKTLELTNRHPHVCWVAMQSQQPSPSTRQKVSSDLHMWCQHSYTTLWDSTKNIFFDRDWYYISVLEAKAPRAGAH